MASFKIIASGCSVSTGRLLSFDWRAANRNDGGWKRVSFVDRPLREAL